jgi:hypothetical protein
MRKVRDYASERKAHEDRGKLLKARHVEQLGALVMAVGADTMDGDVLAGMLLEAVAQKDAKVVEAWRAKGAAFFQRRKRATKPAAADLDEGAEAQPGDDPADAERSATLI